MSTIEELVKVVSGGVKRVDGIVKVDDKEYLAICYSLPNVIRVDLKNKKK